MENWWRSNWADSRPRVNARLVIHNYIQHISHGEAEGNCIVKLEKIDQRIVGPTTGPEDSLHAPSECRRGHYQTGSDVCERMLGDECEQQEEDCYHGDEDVRGILGVSRQDHMRIEEIRRILQLASINEVMRSGRLRSFGHV